MNKKAQYFNFALVLLTLAVLVSTLVFLAPKTEPAKTIGKQQTLLINKYVQGEKLLLFVDLAAKQAAYNSVYDLGQNGGFSFDEYEASASDCGSFNGYNLWNNLNEDCEPTENQLLNSLSNLMENNNLEPLLSFYNFYLPRNNYNINIKTEKSSTHFIGNSKKKVGVDVSNDFVEEGDINGVEFRAAPPENYASRGADKIIDTLVIHYTAGSDIDGALSRLLDSKSKASSHYIIGNVKDNFEVLQLVNDQNRAYHAGCNSKCGDLCKDGCTPCKDQRYYDINSRSIGIEVVNLGNYCGSSICPGTNGLCFEEGNEKTCWEVYPQEQMDKLVAISAYLIKKYHIPIDREHIIGHEEITSCKNDPGKAFDWDNFILRLNNEVKLDDSVLIEKIINANKSDEKQNIQEKSDYYLDPSFNVNIPYNLEDYSGIKGRLSVLSIRCANKNDLKSCLEREKPSNWAIKYNGEFIGSESDWNKYCKNSYNSKDTRIIQICIIDDSIKNVYKNPVDSKKQIMPLVIKFAYYLKESEAPLPITYIEAADKRKAEGSVVLKWNASESTDVVKYKIYYMEGLYNLEGTQYDLDAIKQFAVEKGGIIEADSKNTNVLFNDLNILQEVYCIFKDDKCIFNYMNADKKYVLQDNALYYLSDKKQYVFSIANLIDNTDYTFLVTAVDAEGNEIKGPGLFKANENWIIAQSVDDLEPGLLDISEIKSELGTIVLKWNPVQYNIDGSLIRQAEQIYYYVYNTTDIMTIPFVNNYNLVAGPITNTELTIAKPAVKIGFAVIAWDKSSESHTFSQPYPYFEHLKWKASE